MIPCRPFIYDPLLNIYDDYVYVFHYHLKSFWCTLYYLVVYIQSENTTQQLPSNLDNSYIFTIMHANDAIKMPKTFYWQYWVVVKDISLPPTLSPLSFHAISCYDHIVRLISMSDQIMILISVVDSLVCCMRPALTHGISIKQAHISQFGKACCQLCHFGKGTPAC